MRRTAAFMLSLTCAAALIAAAQINRQGDLIVHEWGTFLSMSGSDGVSLDGMYHEEHALPAFVHSRSKDQLHLHSASIKGETPVIYFYSDHEQKVGVTVYFPRGVWTQWYPQAGLVGPKFARVGNFLKPSDGVISWNVRVAPTAMAPPPKAPSDALWNYARNVDAAPIITSVWEGNKETHETEKFLFYRGLGRADMPLEMSSSNGGTVAVSSGSKYGVGDVFVLQVEHGKGALKHIDRLQPGESITHVIPAMADALPIAQFTERAANDVAARLVESGLFEKEARAMVNTWRTSYFQSDGIRALYILPQKWTDEFIPLDINPLPSRIVRVMVGRTELLSPDRERLAESAVRELASSDSQARNKAFDFLRSQGRYVEPILRRLLHTAKDEHSRTLCKRLLLTDFVTELRSAINSAADGRAVTDDPVHVRAQLASVLREAGLNSEAAEEGQAVLNTLKSRPLPSLDNDGARHHLRAFARAFEGMGRYQEAADWYGRFIEFASRAPKCGACHNEPTAPRSYAWFHDWYAGRKYAEYEAKLGLARGRIADYEAILAKNPDHIVARLKLGYLYEATGQKPRVALAWSNRSSTADAR